MLFTGIGCDALGIEVNIGGDKKKDKEKNSSYVADVIESLEDSDKEDCLYLYKFYAGGAEFIKKNGAKLGTTDKWENVAQRVHKDYGWLDNNLESENPEFSKTLRKELEERGFKQPKQIDRDVTDELVDVLTETAEGALKAAESK
jgi:hypothetical protein